METQVSRVPFLVDPAAPYVTEKYSGDKWLNLFVKSTRFSLPLSVLGGKYSKLVFMETFRNRNQTSICKFQT